MSKELQLILLLVPVSCFPTLFLYERKDVEILDKCMRLHDMSIFGHVELTTIFGHVELTTRSETLSPEAEHSRF